MGLSVMADQLGRRASDQMAAKNAVDLAVMEARLKAQEDETARNRSFRHETNSTLQKLVTNTENMAGDIKAVLDLSPRVAKTESEQQSHVVECNVLRRGLEKYMQDSSEQRAAIQAQQTDIIQKMNTKDTKALIYALGVAVAIIGALLWRFGLPPMGN
jgi:hypothetical protein